MKSSILILAVILSSQAFAQVAQPAAQPQAQVQRRAVILDDRTNQLVEVSPQVQAEPAPTAQVQPIQSQPAPAPAVAPVYILNNQKVGGYQGAQANVQTNQATQAQATGLQEQPAAVVQDSPLKASAAENLRKQRQDAEASTEDGIVQALEKARMEDEMHRRERFNGAIVPAPAPAPQAAPIVAQPAQVQQVVPAPAVAPVAPMEYANKKDEEKVDIKNEIRTAIKEANDEKPKEKQQMYVGALLGMSQYPGDNQIKGNLAAGFSVGMVTSDRFVAEGTFSYGLYSLQDWNYNYATYGTAETMAMKQYDIDAAVKYQLLPGKFRPVVGALLSYTRRTYATQYSTIDYGSTDAYGVGVLGGLDLALSDAMSVGFDFRYKTNVGYTNNTNRPIFGYQSPFKAIEQLDYYTASLTGRLTF